MQVSKNLSSIQKCVNKLEKKGWHIRLIHDPKSTRSTTMLAERGSNRVQKKIYMGAARCVRSDQFCRSTGTRIAFNRLIHNMSAALGREKVKEIFS